jgi:hypothetical protein
VHGDLRVSKRSQLAYAEQNKAYVDGGLASPDLYLVTFVRLRDKVRADAPIDCHLAVGDQLVAIPPRPDACGSKETIEAQG